MKEQGCSTLERIHSAAQAEFLEKGYQAASLRNIVKNAGVTTGAFYGYYGSKEELFSALVDEHYKYIVSKYRESLDGRLSKPAVGKAARKNGVYRQGIHAGNVSVHEQAQGGISPYSDMFGRNCICVPY